MKIGGIKKLEINNYPNKMACVIYVLGCNYRCPWCNSPELIKEDGVDAICRGEGEKALVEFARKHIRDKLSVNALSDEEELQLNSSNSPKQCPYDVIGKDYHKTFAYEISVSEPEMTPTVITKNDQEYQWDIFISYASEDKETVATPLGDILKKKGLIHKVSQ